MLSAQSVIVVSAQFTRVVYAKPSFCSTQRPHSRRRTRVYQPRYRRDCLGELVQIDGSHPVAFYSDKHAVFRVSGPESRRTGTTQFGRALRELAIELICANSSQAKGRVERVNKTLQDRLIKEMRLQNISSVAEANQWIEHFMSD